MEAAREEQLIPASGLDVISYAGEVSVGGYESLCQALAQRKSTKALLVIATPGGDPNAGFRIARALQHAYESFDALVPRYCKSAGTLIVVGAAHLYLDDCSELGPLDIQVKKNDELVGRNSGLDIIQAVNYLQSAAMLAFGQYLVELTQNAGLSTKVASDISSRLTIGLFEPIAAQVDPMRLAEMQRATEIAFEYGQRLALKSGNLRGDGLQKLVTGYPSHGFVIDRKEARNVFLKVSKPEGVLDQISKALHASMNQDMNSKTPKVKLFTIPAQPTGETNENASDTAERTRSDATGEPAVGRRGEDDAASGTTATGDSALASALRCAGA